MRVEERTRELRAKADASCYVPLLQRRGLQLVQRPADNLELAAYKGLLLKDSYWRWPERNLAANAIDFFVQVLGLSFHDAMASVHGSSAFAPFER